ncbi:unnamed protein product, partial [Amoebophrya sp. A25]
RKVSHEIGDVKTSSIFADGVDKNQSDDIVGIYLPPDVLSRATSINHNEAAPADTNSSRNVVSSSSVSGTKDRAVIESDDEVIVAQAGKLTLR